MKIKYFALTILIILKKNMLASESLNPLKSITHIALQSATKESAKYLQALSELQEHYKQNFPAQLQRLSIKALSTN